MVITPPFCGEPIAGTARRASQIVAILRRRKAAPLRASNRDGGRAYGLPLTLGRFSPKRCSWKAPRSGSRASGEGSGDGGDGGRLCRGSPPGGAKAPAAARRGPGGAGGCGGGEGGRGMGGGSGWENLVKPPLPFGRGW